jgi:hypothetical protein
MLAASGAVLGIFALANRGELGRARVGGLLAAGGVWACSFLVNYFTITRAAAAHFPVGYWDGAFAPLPFSKAAVLWYPQTWTAIVDETLMGNPETTALVTLAVLAGVVSFAKRRSFAPLALLVAPFGVLLAISLAHLYPASGGRLSLFLVPCLALLVAEGMGLVHDAIARSSRGLAAVALALPLLYPASMFAYRLVRPERFEESRPLVEYYLTHREPGDGMFSSKGARPSLVYYGREQGEPYLQAILGLRGPVQNSHVAARASRGKLQAAASADPRLLVPARDPYIGSTLHTSAELDAFRRDLLQLAGRGRVWVLLSHHFAFDREALTWQLDALGRRLEEVEAKGAVLFLYDFREPLPAS